jgi:hypothetical protein
MRESYVEDIASHDGPVHALATREGAAKRWVRGARRPAIEPRNRVNRGADAVDMCGRQHRGRRIGEPSADPAGSENLRMRVISPCREPGGLTITRPDGDGPGTGRAGKAKAVIP